MSNTYWLRQLDCLTVDVKPSELTMIYLNLTKISPSYSMAPLQLERIWSKNYYYPEMQTQVVLPLFENDYIGIKLPFTCTCWTGLDKQHFIKHPSWIVDAYLAALSHSIITFCIKELRKTSQGHSWCNIGISSLCCCCDRPSVRLESQNQSFKSQMQRHLRANWT